MRDILFKGYDKKNKTWRKGSLLILNDTTYCTQEDYDKHPDNTKYYIVFQEMTDWGLPNKTFKAEVEKDSIGQYTDYKDKNGYEIFEGDIVKYVSNTLHNEDNNVFIVEWETETNNGWLIRNYNYPDETAVDNEHLSFWLNDYTGLQSEVIGNTYEEKLKEDK